MASSLIGPGEISDFYNNNNNKNKINNNNNNNKNNNKTNNTRHNNLSRALAHRLLSDRVTSQQLDEQRHIRSHSVDVQLSQVWRFGDDVGQLCDGMRRVMIAIENENA